MWPAGKHCPIGPPATLPLGWSDAAYGFWLLTWAWQVDGKTGVELGFNSEKALLTGEFVVQRGAGEI